MKTAITTRRNIFGILAALAALAASPAARAHGASMFIINDNGTVNVSSGDPAVPLDEVLDRDLDESPGGGFEGELPVDILPGAHAAGGYGNAYAFSQLTLQQVGITPGLRGYNESGLSVFGPASEGFTGQYVLSDTQLFPYQLEEAGHYFHNHFDFQAADEGDYAFSFKIVNAVLRDGTRLADSGVITAHFPTPNGASVPEPGSLALLGMAGLPLFAMRRKARR